MPQEKTASGAEAPVRNVAPSPRRKQHNFYFRVLFVLAAIAAAFALYKLATLILLVAGAVVIAVIIHLVSDPLRQRLNLPPKLAVLTSVLFFLSLFAGGGYLFGSEIAAQFDKLAEQLPEATAKMRNMLTEGAFGQAVTGVLSQGEGASALDVAGFLRDMVGGAMTVMVYLVATITAGVIFAMYPAHHRDGLLLLLPPRFRPQVRETANLSGKSLKGWLIGQLIAMFIIGALTSIGLMLIGMPSWLALGMLAGVAQFVPVVGPILSAIPGLAIAASVDSSMLLWALAVYVGVQQLESNFITPFVMRKTASLPIALTVFAIIGFGMLFGPLGAVLATPITVAAYVWIQKLYVEGQFGDDVDIHGE